MPSNFTQHYQLSQWEADDRVQRADFNADNAKLDAAIATKCEIVTGVYTGNGEAEQEIVLGRQPKVVFVSLENCLANSGGGRYEGCATREMPAVYLNMPILTVTEMGFAVYFARYDNQTYVSTNNANIAYRYIAFF